MPALLSRRIARCRRVLDVTVVFEQKFTCRGRWTHLGIVNKGTAFTVWGLLAGGGIFEGFDDGLCRQYDCIV